jgi:hypothetical protein
VFALSRAAIASSSVSMSRSKSNVSRSKSLPKTQYGVVNEGAAIYLSVEPQCELKQVLATATISVPSAEMVSP